MIPRLALDTNAYHALDDGNMVLAEKVRMAVALALPLTVLGELYYGIFAGDRREQNLNNLRRFLQTARLEILRPDEATAKLFGEIATELRRGGRPIQQNDMWIAALCKQYDYALATADTDLASITGLELVHFDR